MNKQLATIGLVFIVCAVGLSLAFGVVFDSVLLGIGPALAVSVGIAMSAWFAVRDRRT